MAAEIMVKYGAMAAGSATMRSTTAQLRAESDRLASAATAVKATWTAQSQTAFEARHQEIHKLCDHIDATISAHAGALDQQTGDTQSTDSSAAAGFGG